jgi:hypothetical protein
MTKNRGSKIRKFGKLVVYLQPKCSIIAIMTTLELRTSIKADLDQMSVEMLENVSRYVKRFYGVDNLTQ